MAVDDDTGYREQGDVKKVYMYLMYLMSETTCSQLPIMSEKVHDPDFFPPAQPEEKSLTLKRNWTDTEEQKAKRK